MGKDLKVEGDLRVKDDLHVDGHVKVEHHLTVEGHLNFGDGTVTQLTSNTTPVTVNSASGVITMNALVGANSVTPFTVFDTKVKNGSVVLLSLMTVPTTAVNPTAIALIASNVSAGQFTVTVTSTVATTVPVSIGFLVC